jgi:hypothetical protein
MSDPVTTPALAPEAAAAKANIQPLIGNPDSAYWRGDEARGVTAAELQQEYQDILRAELVGEPHKVGPDHVVDIDMPREVNGYVLTGLPIYNAEDRAFVDKFLTAAHAGGLGQQKVERAVRWAFTHSGPVTEGLVGEFVRDAASWGWSRKAIETCVEFAKKQV